MLTSPAVCGKIGLLKIMAQHKNKTIIRFGGHILSELVRRTIKEHPIIKTRRTLSAAL